MEENDKLNVTYKLIHYSDVREDCLPKMYVKSILESSYPSNVCIESQVISKKLFLVLKVFQKYSFVCWASN